MNDEQFEATMECLRDELADKLRARDTAQREALARVEADLKREKAEAWELCGIIDARTEERDTAQAQLAEAVGLLKAIQDCDASITDAQANLIDSNIDAFLARHAPMPDMTAEQSAAISQITRDAYVAQAEQQEAREETLDDILNSPCAPCEEEAQDAQPGEFQREDRYIVIKRKDLERLPLDVRMPFILAWSELGPQLPKREYLVIEGDWPEYEPTWAAIQARVEGGAALATQPAAQDDGSRAVGPTHPYREEC